MNETTEEKTKKKRKTQGEDFRTAIEASAEAEMKEREEANPPKRVVLTLAVKLTDAEIQAKGQELVDAIAEERTLKAKKKLSADNYKAQIELSHQEQDRLATLISTKSEQRDVECVECYEFQTNTVSTTRTDTGEIISTRAMTRAERQPMLPSIDAPKSGPRVAEFDPEEIDNPEAILDLDDGSAE